MSHVARQRAYSKGSQFPPLDNGTLRCYSMRFCPYAQRTRLVLAHKNISHQVVNIALKPECPEWFTERNPLGQVPVLEKDGKVIYNSAVCCDYLDDEYPENRLTPRDPYEKAKDKMLLKRFANVPSFFSSLFLSNGENEDATGKIMKDLEPFEEELEGRGTFFGGDAVSMLDYMIWPWIELVPLIMVMYQTDVLPFDKFPLLNNWTNKMTTLTVVQDCYIEADVRSAFYMSESDKPDYNVGLD